MADGQYDNTNRGVLFKNEKDGNEKRPDYTGKINIEGKDFWLSAWLQKSKDGSKTFMSLSVTDPATRQQQNGPAAPATPDTVITDIGDEPINLDDISF